jgi:signal transduction histidine kinase
MQFRALARTTTFRLSLLYGLIFALTSVALLGTVYLRSTVYLTKRVDDILNTEADALMQSPRSGMRERLVNELTLNGHKTSVFALFSRDGTPIAGNLNALPAELRIGASPVELAGKPGLPAYLRLMARTLPTGEILVVGRDVHQVAEMRSIVAYALRWSGAVVILVGLGCGTALSIGPLRRLRTLQVVAALIAEGDMKRQMPVSARGDELDMFASTVNGMMDQVAALVSEVKGATDTIAHDLLTPLTRASMQLQQLAQLPRAEPADLISINADVTQVLERFRAILRVAELESRERTAGFSRVDLADVIGPVGELYQPLAEANDVRLRVSAGGGAIVRADPKLLFEALCNLVDNAIKFSGPGGVVQVHLEGEPEAPSIVVQDTGPGIPLSERSAVLQRFYRASRNPDIPGSGIGLSVVAAIVRLHRFNLSLGDASPGLRAAITCRATGAAAQASGITPPPAAQ